MMKAPERRPWGPGEPQRFRLFMSGRPGHQKRLGCALLVGLSAGEFGGNYFEVLTPGGR